MSSKLRGERHVSAMWGPDAGGKVAQLLGASGEKVEEEIGLLGQSEPLGLRPKYGGRWKAISLVFFGCCLGLGWLWNDCLPTDTLPEPEEVPPTFELIKYAAAASATPTGLLEVFQVYQPVLTPQGATDETILSDGVENTTTVAAAASPSSCEVLLMDHVFAYSYGIPFVGTWSSSCVKMDAC